MLPKFRHLSLLLLSYTFLSSPYYNVVIIRFRNECLEVDYLIRSSHIKGSRVNFEFNWDRLRYVVCTKVFLFLRAIFDSQILVLKDPKLLKKLIDFKKAFKVEVPGVVAWESHLHSFPFIRISSHPIVKFVRAIRANNTEHYFTFNFIKQNFFLTDSGNVAALSDPHLVFSSEAAINYLMSHEGLNFFLDGSRWSLSFLLLQGGICLVLN